MQNSISSICFNCCFFNCLSSMNLSIFGIISSSIGLGLNSLLLSLSRKVLDASNFLFSVQVINISFFAGGGVISTILTFLKKFEKIAQGYFYGFSVKSTKLYSILSKILMLINIIGFFYLISFTPFLTISITEDAGIQLFNTSFINYVGPGREIEYKLKYKNKTLHCEKYGCLPDDNIDDINEEKVDFGDVILLLFYSLLTCLIMYFNGESFSSDSKRISFLSSGKLSLEFKPIDIVIHFVIENKFLLY